MLPAEEDLLVMMAQEGDSIAFNKICKKYHTLLLRFALKICSDSDMAEETVQEVWLYFAKNIRKLDDPRALRAWLYRLVRWRVVDMARLRQKHGSYEVLRDDHVVDESVEPVGDTSSDLLAAINSLSDLDRQVVHLFYLDELTLKEISLVLDVPVGSVKSRLYRARGNLKKKLQKD